MARPVGKETRRQKDGTVRILMKLVVSLSLCLLVSLSAAGAAHIEQKQGAATLRIEVERIENGRPEIRLSDKITLTLSVEGSPSLEVQPLEKVTASPDWEVRQRFNPQKTNLADARVRWQQTFTLDPVKNGDVPLPVEADRYRESSGSIWEEATWKAIPVHVSTEVLEADLRELRDATPPEQLPPVPVWRVPVGWAALPLALTWENRTVLLRTT